MECAPGELWDIGTAAVCQNIVRWNTIWDSQGMGAKDIILPLMYPPCNPCMEPTIKIAWPTWNQTKLIKGFSTMCQTLSYCHFLIKTDFMWITLYTVV